ncbi:unnamed protein product (macronuclear) [Paramecium tetraurelia]|uniref:Uncharacterized protein n=1 Tax=Paramecium tetraurelia TaxID=5888 RepID=A0CE06_PARTE|nr:uncharacterized protein GSPATT00007235001 [Paramecium tetraurelia]CAK69023.1 unnamed protein product [Paramecium tetraurelia]|eukprot:XP_001436420.1 hypothetical protein (macronuclear) [Paramecium tetraurelia strain d4-2]
MDFDQQKTNEIKQYLKYKRLMEWSIENGVLMKGVDFPASFGDVTGVVASEDLPSNTAFICIPQALIISPDKCKSTNLNTVYNSHPEMFDKDETNDAEFNMLGIKLICIQVFYMFNEKKKGELSFYYPYISAVQANNTLLTWSNEDLKKIEDPIILEEFANIKQDVLGLWGKAKQIFDNNEDVFGIPRLTDKKDFYWAVECVMSRCFGWSLKSTCIIPIADFLNHSNRACTHYMVHKGLEKGIPLKQKDQAHFQQQYILKRNKINLSILGIENGNEMQIVEDEKIRFVLDNKEYLRDLKVIDDLESLSIDGRKEIINQIYYEQMMQDPKMNVWDLDSMTSSDSEDNDSDEEIKLTKHKELEILKIKEIAEWKRREEQKRIEKQYQSIQLKNQPIVTVTLNPKKKNKVIIRGLPQYQIEAIKAKQQIMNGRFSKLQSEPTSSSDNESETSEESKWDWLNEYDQDAYFCIATTEPIKKFEQVTVSYGRRTNRFLISWYGFALSENIYSSFNFRLWLNTDIFKDQEKSRDEILNTIIIQKLIPEGESILNTILYNGHEIPVASLSKEFRIKRNKLNIDTIIFLRLLLRVHYGNEKDLLSTIPVSIDYEIFVMEFYYSLLQNLMKSYSQDLAQDLKELEQKMEYQKRFAVYIQSLITQIYINKEKKEILIGQMQIVEEAIRILQKFKETKQLRESYLSDIRLDVSSKISLIKGLKQYLKFVWEFL